MDIAEAYTKFPSARETTAYIDTVSFSGSGFGITPEGERIFFNARLVETVGVSPGDVVTCLILPNYPDKQDKVPWRGIRATRVSTVVVEDDPDFVEDAEGDEDDVIEDDPDTEEDDDPASMTIGEKILRHLQDVGPTSTRTLARAIGDDSGKSTKTSNTCRSLHLAGVICRADVYRKATQKKATVTVWAMSPVEIEVEQDEGLA